MERSICTTNALDKKLPRFHPNIWGFDKSSVEQLLTHLPPNTRVQAINQLNEGGGKAFGLTLCAELLNTRIALHDHHLTIPRWEAYRAYPDILTGIPTVPRFKIGKLSVGRRVDNSKPQHHPELWREKYIVRSSPHTEDWLERSAEHHSVLIQAGQIPLQSLSELVPHDSPFIVQNYEPGIGVVVDICWSALMSCTLGKVSWGRTIGQSHTSATWDYGGPCIVVDVAKKDVALPPPQLHIEQVAAESVDLATQLYRLLCEHDFTCAMRFELIKTSEKNFSLVQIRPLPVQLPENFSPVEPKSCLITGRVQGVFDVTGHALRSGKNLILSEKNNGPVTILPSFGRPKNEIPCAKSQREALAKKLPPHSLSTELPDTVHGILVHELTHRPIRAVSDGMIGIITGS